MSLCVIVRSNEHVWVGADTALSTSVKGVKYRCRNDTREKVFPFKDDIIFCSGLVYVSDLVKEKILGMKTLDVNAVQSYIRDVVKSLPKEYENDETGIIICKSNGEVFSLVQESDFEIIEYKLPSSEEIMQVITGGYKREEANELAKEAIFKEKNSIINVFGKVYGDLSSEIIGGRLVLYHIDILKNSTEKYLFEIKEPNKDNYRYYSYDNTTKTAVFRGSVYANDFHFNSGGSVKTLLDQNSQKINHDFLELKGLNINNRFMVDSEGRVTITDGSISFNSLPSNVARLSDIPPAYTPPNYIKSSYIDMTKILSPIIGAGAFYGAKYYNLTNAPSATVNPTGDMYMEMYGVGSYKGWRVQNESGGGWFGTVLDAYVSGASARLNLGGQEFLRYDPITSPTKVWAIGSWDFQHATVYNLNIDTTATWA